MENDILNTLKQLSEKYGVPGINFENIIIYLSNLDIIPYEVAKQHKILPLIEKKDTIFLAMSNPTDKKVIDELEFVTGKKVFPYISIESQLIDMIEECYNLKLKGERFFIGSNAKNVISESELKEVMNTYENDNEVSIDVIFNNNVLVLSEKLQNNNIIEDDGIYIDTSELEKESNIDLKEEKKVDVDNKDKKKILVVDDEEDIRKLIIKLLEEKGIEVLSASRGLEALKLIQQSVPDLVILDAMLPEVHGFDICKKIKSSEKYKNIPVIMISAIYRGWRYAKDLKESYGVDMFLEKPFKLTDLLKSIELLLSKKNMTKDSKEKLSQKTQQYLNMGVKLYQKGDINAAIEYIKKGIEVDQFSYMLHYYLGLLFIKQNNIYLAIRVFERALEYNPEFFPVIKNLALLYQKAGFKNKSIEMWERAISCTNDETTKKKLKEYLVKIL